MDEVLKRKKITLRIFEVPIQMLWCEFLACSHKLLKTCAHMDPGALL
jgi:hypothetical protein